MKNCTIIGQGIAGLSACFRLLQRGVAVEFIGPEHTEKSASKAAVGVSSQKGVLFPRDPLFQLKAIGHSHLPNWFKEIETVSGIEIKINRDWGVIEKPSSDEKFQKTSERIYKRDFLGCYRVEVLRDNNAQLRILKYPDDYFFDVTTLFRSLREANKKLGATYNPSLATKISVSNKNYQLHLGKEVIERSNVLIAAGFESQGFLSALNLSKRSLTGISGRSLEKENPGDEFCEVSGQHAIVNISGKLRMGSTSHPSEVKEDLRDFEKLQSTFPDYSLGGAISNWGVRARFRDRHPRYGVLHELSNDSKLWISCGFYKSGLQLSDLISRALVQKMLGEFSESNLDSRVDFNLMKNFIW